MDGIVLIDKPKGPSSFDVVRKLRRLLGVKKIGHAGTLDPLASGLLVICLGRYTKFAGICTEKDKVYEAVIALGTTTTTDDQEGEIKETRSYLHITLQDVKEALRQFIGNIYQVPPQYSAVKVNGKRAYALARSEQTVVFTKRAITIFSLEVLHFCHGEIRVRVHCGKGTYIRSLARDLGEALGVGAHAKEIRRVRSGKFDVDSALAFEDLTQESLVKHISRDYQNFGLESVEVSERQKNDIIHGRPLMGLDIQNSIGLAIYDAHPLALLKKEQGLVKVSRVI